MLVWGCGGTAVEESTPSRDTFSCEPHVADVSDSCGDDCPASMTSASDKQFCTVVCSERGNCPGGTACKELAFGGNVCAIPCDAGCPADFECVDAFCAPR